MVKQFRAFSAYRFSMPLTWAIGPGYYIVRLRRFASRLFRRPWIVRAATFLLSQIQQPDVALRLVNRKINQAVVSRDPDAAYLILAFVKKRLHPLRNYV